MNNEVNTFKLTCKKGVDDLLNIYAFSGNSQGDETRTNEISDYIAAKGWLSYGFENVDITDQEAIYKESKRRRLENEKYIDTLIAEGRYKEEYIISINFHHNPEFDGPLTPNENQNPLSSYRMIFF